MIDILDFVQNTGPHAAGAAAVLDIILRVTVLLSAAISLAFVMKRSSASLRHLLWTLSLVGALLIPPFSWAFPAWQWSILPQPRESLPAALQQPQITLVAIETPSDNPLQPLDSPDVLMGDAFADMEMPMASGGENSSEALPPVAEKETAAGAASAVIVSPDRFRTALMFFAVLWAAGSFLGFVWLAIGIIAARHVARCALCAADSHWQHILRQLLDQCGYRRPVEVRECRQISVPMTWGLRRPLILVPAGSSAWPESTKRSVLLHELGHIRRGDCLMHLLGRLACAAYWFHPLVWLAARQLRKTSEQAADDTVLSSAVAPPDYAEQLVGIAAQTRGIHLFGHVVLPMAGPSDLEGRVLAILDPKRNHRSLKRKTCCALMTIAAIVLIPCAILRLGYAEDKKSQETASDASITTTDQAPAPASQSSEETHESSQMTTAEVFVKLSDADQRAVLVKAFQRHLEQRKNLSYETEQVYRAFESDTWEPDKPLRRYPPYFRYVRRYWQLGDSYKTEMYQYDDPKAVDFKSYSAHADNALEGVRRNVSIYKQEGQTRLQGQVVYPYQPTIEERFHTFPSPDDLTDSSGGQQYFYQYLVEKKDTFEIKSPVAGDKVQLIVPWRNDKQVFILDPQKDFLPIGFDAEWEIPATKDRRDHWSKVKFEVQESRLFDRIWMPVKMIRKTLSSENILTIVETNILRMETGNIKPAELLLPFTSGTQVADVIEGVTYTADAQGNATDVKDAPNWKHDPPKGWHQGRVERAYSLASRIPTVERKRLVEEREAKSKPLDEGLRVLRASPPATQAERIEAALKMLREYRVGEREDDWAVAIRELITIGKPAVPRLIEELDRTDSDKTLRAMGFVLRGIGDPRAVPALIRAIPRLIQPSSSDFGLTIKHDPELLKFMWMNDVEHVQNRENRKVRGLTLFSYGRPIREVMPALEKLTGQSLGWRELNFADIQADGIIQLRHQRMLFLDHAKKWADWWSHNWKSYVPEEADAQLDRTKESIERFAKEVAHMPQPPLPTEIPTGPFVKLGEGMQYHQFEPYLNLDVGPKIPRPEELLKDSPKYHPSPQLVAWAAQKGVDLLRIEIKRPGDSKTYYGYQPVGMKVWKIDNKRLQNLEKELQQSKKPEIPPLWKGPISSVDQREDDVAEEKAATFLFITREGTCGTMQIRSGLFHKFVQGAPVMGPPVLEYHYIYKCEPEKPLSKATSLFSSRQLTVPAKRRVDMPVIIARHVMLLDGREIINWAELEKRIAALPDPSQAHPHFYATKGAYETGVYETAKEEIWRLHRKFNFKGHSEGSLGPRADFRYDRIKTSNDLVPNKDLRVEGRVVDNRGEPVAGAEVLLVNFVDISIPSNSYEVALVEGRIRNPLEHVITRSDDKGQFALYPPKELKSYVVALHPTAGFALVRQKQFLDDGRVRLLSWATLTSRFAEEAGRRQEASLSTRIEEKDGFPEIDFTQYWSDLKKEQLTDVFRFAHVPPIFATTLERTFPEKEGGAFSLPGATVSLLPAETRQLNLGPLSEKQREWLERLRTESRLKQKEFSAKSTSATPVTVKSDKQFQLLVLGPDGKPVPRANIEIRGGVKPKPEEIQRGRFIRVGPYGTFVESDDDGRLVFELSKKPQVLSLSIKQPGFGPYWAEWDSREHPEPIPAKFIAKLDAGWTVGGVVVDDKDKPIKGADVDLSIEYKKRPGDFRQMGVGGNITTDEAGRWSFACVPDSMSEVHMCFNHPDYRPNRRQLTRSEFGIGAGEQPKARIAMERGLEVTGRVTDESGEPIAGAVVRTKFLNDLRKSTTGKDGTYRLLGCEPRMARIVVSAAGKARDFKEVRVEPDMKPVDFVMKPGGKIRIRVLDNQGNPVARTRIFPQRWRGRRIEYFEFADVNQYTNAEGVWQWDEAPLDEIKADICPPGGIQIPYQPFVARNDEYVIHTLPKLVIYGSVVDRDTEKPIKSFRVVPGIRGYDEPNAQSGKTHVDWARQESYVATDGRYEVKPDRAYLAHLVRIEADGYEVAESRDIKSDEGRVRLDFQLKPADDVAAHLLTPDGKPAVGAKIALGIAGSQISVQNGDIDDRSTYAARYEADAAGRLSFPAQGTDFQLVITHPSGFAYLKSSDGPIPANIRLTPWARVEGTFRVGRQTVANAAIILNTEALHSYGDDVPNIFVQYEVTTDSNGRFVFERVFPGDGRIGRRILLMVDDGAKEVTSSKMVSAHFTAGKTTNLDLGGAGRAVIGKLAPPSDFKSEVLWNFALIHASINLSQPSPLPVPEDIQNDPEKRKVWFDAWKTTVKGKAWQAVYEKHEKLRKASPYFSASVDRDGSFHIDDMPPGDYVLNVHFSQHPAGYLSNYRFTAPQASGDESSEPIDLGVLTLKHNQSPQPIPDKQPEQMQITKKEPRSQSEKVSAEPPPALFTASCKVVDPQGRPVAGAEVLARNGEGGFEYRSYLTDANGRVSIPWRKASLFNVFNLIARRGEDVGWHGHRSGPDIPEETIEKPIKITLHPRSQIIEGTCVDAEGRPLAGVHVRVDGIVNAANGGLFAYSPQTDLIGSAVSDAQGRYAIKLPEFKQCRIVAEHPEFVVVESSFDADGKPQRIVLSEPAGAIQGRVVDAENTPVRGAHIFAQSLLKGRPGVAGGRESVTDEKGRYTMRSVAPGYWNVLFGGIADNDKLTAAATDSLEVKAGETATADFRLTPGRLLRGRVLDAVKNTPLAGVPIGYYGSARPRSGAACKMIETDEKGRFQFRVPPGESRVYVAQAAVRGKPTSRTLIVEPDRDPAPVVFKVTLDEESPKYGSVLKPLASSHGKPENGDAEMDAAYTIHGAIRTSDGKPVPSATIRVWSPQRLKTSQASYQESMTFIVQGGDFSQFLGTRFFDAKGKRQRDLEDRFYKNKLGKPWYLVIDAPGYARPDPIEFIFDEVIKPITIVMQRPTLVPVRGRVLDAAGQPIAQANVSVSLSTVGDAAEEPWGPEYLTDADGKFEVKQVHVGNRFAVRIEKENYLAALSPRVHVEKSDPIDLGDLRLKTADETKKHSRPAAKRVAPSEPPPAFLTAFGKVVDPDGKPVTGAAVYLREWSTYRISTEPYNRDANDVLAATKTDARGEFRFENVAARPMIEQRLRQIP